MINNYNIQGITLKSYNFSDYDKIFIIFSKEIGLIRTIAKGVRKPNNKFGGMLEPLNINKILLKKGKNLDQIYQCQTIYSFSNIRKDYNKLVYSFFLFELVFNFLNEGESSENVYDLLVFTLKYFEENENILSIVIWFEIIFLKLIGYENNYDYCYNCQKKLVDSKLGYDIYSGNIFCSKCIDKNSKIIDLKILEGIKKIKNNYLYIKDSSLLEEIQNLFKIYLSNLSGRKIKTLDIIGK